MIGIIERIYSSYSLLDGLMKHLMMSSLAFVVLFVIICAVIKPKKKRVYEAIALVPVLQMPCIQCTMTATTNTRSSTQRRI